MCDYYSNKCLKCLNIANVGPPPQCLCNEEYYFEINTNLCEKCKSPCRTCVTTEDNCITCIEGYEIILDGIQNNKC